MTKEIGIDLTDSGSTGKGAPRVSNRPCASSGHDDTSSSRTGGISDKQRYPGGREGAREIKRKKKRRWHLYIFCLENFNPLYLGRITRVAAHNHRADDVTKPSLSLAFSFFPFPFLSLSLQVDRVVAAPFGRFPTGLGDITQGHVTNSRLEQEQRQSRSSLSMIRRSVFIVLLSFIPPTTTTSGASVSAQPVKTLGNTCSSANRTTNVRGREHRREVDPILRSPPPPVPFYLSCCDDRAVLCAGSGDRFANAYG